MYVWAVGQEMYGGRAAGKRFVLYTVERGSSDGRSGLRRAAIGWWGPGVVNIGKGLGRMGLASARRRHDMTKTGEDRPPAVELSWGGRVSKGQAVPLARTHAHGEREGTVRGREGDLIEWMDP